MKYPGRSIFRCSPFLLLFIATMAFAQNDTIIYGANAYNFNQMVEINLTDGNAQVVDTMPFGTQAMAQDPQTGYVYFYEWQDAGNEFAYWDPATGNFTTVRTYNPSPGFYAKRMDFAPDGTLYLIDNEEGLYSIDKLTGDLVFLGSITGMQTGPYAATGDIAFAPDGTLYAANYRRLYEIDLTTLAATELYSGMIQTSGPNEVAVWTGLAYCDGLLYASSAEQRTGLSAIFSIDPTTGDEIYLFTAPTVLNDLGSCVASMEGGS